MGDWKKQKQAQVVTGSGTKRSEAPLPQLDLCVMNPPFVRSVGGNLLFGSLPLNRSAMQKELRDRISKNASFASITAGLGAVFVAVADQHIKRGGRIALVLPAALTTGPAWEKTRQLLAETYFIEIVASHDPEEWAFSENTDLSEVLVVARKRLIGEGVEGRGTVFVNLWVNPRIAADALGIADTVLKSQAAELGTVEEPSDAVAPIHVGDAKWGEAIEIPTTSLTGNGWLFGCYARTELVRTVALLRKGSLRLPGENSAASLPMVPLKTLAILGPDRRDIYDGFNKSSSTTPFPALWGHKAKNMRSIGGKPNLWLSPLQKAKKGRPFRDASTLWSRAGRIMIGERLWLVSQRVTAVYLSSPALANVWWPVRLKKEGDERQEKILALWLNSTLGILMTVAHRVPTRGPWVSFKKPTLEGLPVLDVTALGETKIANLAKTFDSLASEPLAPIPSLAIDPVRRRIDEALMTELGLPDVRILAQLLAEEPIVSNKRIVGAAKQNRQATIAIDFSKSDTAAK